MKRGFVVAVGGAAIVIAGLSGCSSDEQSGTSGETSSAAAAEGTSTVTIDGQDQEVRLPGSYVAVSTGQMGEVHTVGDMDGEILLG